MSISHWGLFPLHLVATGRYHYGGSPELEFSPYDWDKWCAWCEGKIWNELPEAWFKGAHC